jgi:hypothetical protein
MLPGHLTSPRFGTAPKLATKKYYYFFFFLGVSDPWSIFFHLKMFKSAPKCPKLIPEIINCDFQVEIQTKVQWRCIKNMDQVRPKYGSGAPKIAWNFFRVSMQLRGLYQFDFQVKWLGQDPIRYRGHVISCPISICMMLIKEWTQVPLIITCPFRSGGFVSTQSWSWLMEALIILLMGPCSS